MPPPKTAGAPAFDVLKRGPLRVCLAASVQRTGVQHHRQRIARTMRCVRRRKVMLRSPPEHRNVPQSLQRVSRFSATDTNLRHTARCSGTRSVVSTRHSPPSSAISTAVQRLLKHLDEQEFRRFCHHLMPAFTGQLQDGTAPVLARCRSHPWLQMYFTTCVF